MQIGMINILMTGLIASLIISRVGPPTLVYVLAGAMIVVNVVLLFLPEDGKGKWRFGALPEWVGYVFIGLVGLIIGGVTLIAFLNAG